MKTFKEYDIEKSSLDESLTAGLIGAGLGAGALALGAHLLKKKGLGGTLERTGEVISNLALSPVKAAASALGSHGGAGGGGMGSEAARRLGEKEGREAAAKAWKTHKAKKEAAKAKAQEERHKKMSSYGFNPDDPLHHAHFDQFERDLPSGQTKLEGKKYRIWRDSATGIAKKEHIKTSKQSDYTAGMRVPRP